MCSSEKQNSSRVFYGLLVPLVAAVILLVIHGCATTESDIPWNAPQPWEGSPTLPGLPTYE